MAGERGKTGGRRGALARLARAVACVAVLALAAWPVGAALADDDGADYSFYKLASATTSYYQLCQVGSDEAKGGAKTLTDFIAEDGFGSPEQMVQAGALVGYADESFEDGIAGLVSRISSGQQSTGYESFQGDGSQAVYAYTAYGHALAQIGLDETKNDNGDFMWLLRGAAGIILRVAYEFSNCADQVMRLAIQLLTYLNPFQLVADSGFFASYAAPTGDAASGSPLVSPLTKGDPAAMKADLGMGEGAVDLLAPARTFMSALYDLSFRFGFVFLSLGLALIAFAAVRRQSLGAVRSRGIGLAKRLLFIMVGVPLLGVMYTGILNGVADMVGADDGGAQATLQDDVITSSLVDFEGWANNGGLALPDGYTITVDCTENGPGNVRSLTFAGDTGGKVAEKSLAQAINDAWGRKGVSNDAAGDAGAEAGLVNPVTGGKAKAYSLDLIGRYMGNTLYTAADYESAYRTRLPVADREDFVDHVDEVGKVSTFGDTAHTDGVDGGFFRPGNADTIEVDGMDDAKGAYEAMGLLHDGSPVSLHADLAGVSGRSGDSKLSYASATLRFTGKGSASSARGLSSLSTYNYLTSEFTDSGVQIHSANKLLSKATVKSHNSVNFVGSGAFGKVLAWLDTVTLLVALGVVGWCYAVMLVLESLRRVFHTVAQLPLATMGAMTAITRLVTGVFLLVAQTILTVVMYSVASTLIASVSRGIPTVAAEAGIPALSTVSVVASILCNVLLIVVSITARKGIVAAMNEAIGRFVDRVFYGSTRRQTPGEDVAHDSDRPGALSRAAGGAMGGAAEKVASLAGRGDDGADDGADAAGGDRNGRGDESLEDAQAQEASERGGGTFSEGSSDDPDTDAHDAAVGSAAEEAGATSCAEAAAAADGLGDDSYDDGADEVPYDPYEAYEAYDGDDGHDGQDGPYGAGPDGGAPEAPTDPLEGVSREVADGAVASVGAAAAVPNRGEGPRGRAGRTDGGEGADRAFDGGIPGADPDGAAPAGPGQGTVSVPEGASKDGSDGDGDSPEGRDASRGAMGGIADAQSARDASRGVDPGAEGGLPVEGPEPYGRRHPVDLPDAPDPAARARAAAQAAAKAARASVGAAASAGRAVGTAAATSAGAAAPEPDPVSHGAARLGRAVSAAATGAVAARAAASAQSASASAAQAAEAAQRARLGAKAAMLPVMLEQRRRADALHSKVADPRGRAFRERAASRMALAADPVAVERICRVAQALSDPRQRPVIERACSSRGLDACADGIAPYLPDLAQALRDMPAVVSDLYVDVQGPSSPTGDDPDTARARTWLSAHPAALAAVLRLTSDAHGGWEAEAARTKGDGGGR
ncbi:hypothetical protein [Caniella muris]|uniref:hypothetical protein n=1 Tax=Caniella muris TaxID=2941502 RepID=UPI00203EA4CF|nr:hypothetical protein [Caniella muris]